MAVKGGVKFSKKKGFGTVALPDASAVKEANNNPYGAAVFAELSNRQIKSERQDIPLSKIRLNPDNAIFNEEDTEEDIEVLAEDIQRNGLMHNIVVFPEEQDKRTVYMLLSGERRYKALCKLAKEDARWNIVKACNVITSELSDNEKKVLLYSANLQVRGGFGNEKIRRKAVTAFIDCLQKEPYNMTEVDAKKAIREISPENTKTLDKDVRVERDLCEELKEMLDNKLLKRSECEIYQRYKKDKQIRIADKLQQLFDVDCFSEGGEYADRNSVEVRRDNLHISFREALYAADKADYEDEFEEMFAKALSAFDSDLQTLKEKAGEYAEAKKSSSEKRLADIEYTNINEAARERTQRKKQAEKDDKTAVQRKVPQMKKQLDSILNRRNFTASIKEYTQEARDRDIETLNEVIETATRLKELIASVQ